MERGLVAAFLDAERERGRVTCWDADFEKKQFDLRVPRHEITCLAFSPDGKLLAAGSMNGFVVWIDVARGVVTKMLNVASRSGKDGRVESLAFSPDGKLLATGSGSYNRGYKWGETFLIDTETSEVFRMRMAKDDRPIRSVAFSPNGRYLAAASTCLRLWEFEEMPTSER